MKASTAMEVPQAAVAALFEPEIAGRILRVDAAIDWPQGMVPHSVRVERGWPTREGGFVVEWSFDLGTGSRHLLFGASCADAETADQPIARQAVVTTQGIRGILVNVRPYGLRIHSLDRDPGMPHLERCLDGREMAEQLAPLWQGGVVRYGANGHDVECAVKG